MPSSDPVAKRFNKCQRHSPPVLLLGQGYQRSKEIEVALLEGGKPARAMSVLRCSMTATGTVVFEHRKPPDTQTANKHSRVTPPGTSVIQQQMTLIVRWIRAKTPGESVACPYR